MMVLLSNSQKDDRRPGFVRQRQGGAHFLVHSVKLGQNQTINRSARRLPKHFVLRQAVVTHQGFAHQDAKVGLILRHELAQRLHQWHVILHATRCIDQDDVVAVGGGVLNGGFGDGTGIFGIALRKERDV